MKNNYITEVTQNFIIELPRPKDRSYESFFLCNFIYFIIAILLLPPNLYAQTDWVKWRKADVSYQIENPVKQRDYSFDNKTAGDLILKSSINAYWFFLSDVDGDNCSFSPTCSNFFLQAVKMTNIFQGSLMFFDRFTRDMDIFGKIDHYPRVPDGHFYDPPSLYLLDPGTIEFIPYSEVVKNE